MKTTVRIQHTNYVKVPLISLGTILSINMESQDQCGTITIKKFTGEIIGIKTIQPDNNIIYVISIGSSRSRLNTISINEDGLIIESDETDEQQTENENELGTF